MTENTTPRYVPAEKAFIAGDGTTSRPVWGVLDNETGLFAPFGGDEGLAAYAAEKVAEKPGAGWDFVPVAAPAPRFEWIEANYEDGGELYERVSGVVDNELGRFAPFGYSDGEESFDDVVASVTRNPEDYAYTSTFTRIN